MLFWVLLHFNIEKNHAFPLKLIIMLVELDLRIIHCALDLCIIYHIISLMLLHVFYIFNDKLWETLHMRCVSRALIITKRNANPSLWVHHFQLVNPSSSHFANGITFNQVIKRKCNDPIRFGPSVPICVHSTVFACKNARMHDPISE